MHFVIEESSWVGDGGGDFVERVELLLDRLDVADERGEEFAASRELFDLEVGGEPLSQVLWELPREVVERLSSHFGRLTYWDDDETIAVLDATIAGAEVFSPSAVFVHERARGGETIACVPLPGRWSGETPVVVDDRAALIHFIVDESTHRGFYRAAMAAQKLDARAVEALAPHAFPDTFFMEGVWRDVRRFDGGYERARAGLLDFLGIFDDHAAWIFTDETGRLSPRESAPAGAHVNVSDDLVERRFRGFGFVVAPEKPNVRADAECRRARTRSLGDEQLYCEWHYKIELHANRVHVHRPTKGSEGRAIVAIFADHLPLP